MPLERQQDSLRDSFLPSIANEAESSKEMLCPSPCEACVKPVTAHLKTFCRCQALHHCPPGASFSEQVTNPTLSFGVTLHTSIFPFIKEMTETTRSTFSLIYMIKTSMHFSLAMSVYTISAKNPETSTTHQMKTCGFFS